MLGRRSGVVASFLRGISFELKSMEGVYGIPSLPYFARPSVIRHHLMEALGGESPLGVQLVKCVPPALGMT